MKIEIEPAVFADAANTMQLDALAFWALQGRHRLIVHDEEAREYVAWLASLTHHHRESWDEAIKDGYRQEALEPAKRGIVVADISSSDWSARPARLRLNEAVVYSSKPFRILLEDSVSARNFLIKMANDVQKRHIQMRANEGTIVIEHGGGLSTMLRRVVELHAQGASEQLLTWAMFDSDALQPSCPSQQSSDLKEQCLAAQISHHQLGRRSIENYLPKNAMRNWTFRRRHSRERKFLALMALTDEQKFHYNFKHGFNGDKERPAPGAGTLYQGVADKDLTALAQGFGSSIASLFETDDVQEHDLRRDGGWSEMNAVVTELIALIR